MKRKPTTSAFLNSKFYILHSVFCLVTCVLGLVSGVRAQDVMPNSSKECAICHIRWIRAFDRNQSPEDRMEDVLERQAGSGDMCLSCHDGSVADSRFKVWSTSHHTTDSVPSPGVRIPTDIFPLDDQGRMTCATCHTAHAVPESSDLRTVIFLRQPNVDSSLCLACHPEHAVKSDFQRPLGEVDYPIPQEILDAGGKTSEQGHTIICQTCHIETGGLIGTLHDLRTSAPDAHNVRGETSAESGPCGSCHLMHRDPETGSIWAQGSMLEGKYGSGRCTCCHGQGEPVSNRVPKYVDHPDVALVNRTRPEQPGYMPTFDATGEPSDTGAISCLTCHEPHVAPADIGAPGGNARHRRMFLRPQAAQELCADCHGAETLWRFLYYHKEQRNPFPDRDVNRPLSEDIPGTEGTSNKP